MSAIVTYTDGTEMHLCRQCGSMTVRHATPERDVWSYRCINCGAHEFGPRTERITYPAPGWQDEDTKP